jgi:hypothetical protein
VRGGRIVVFVFLCAFVAIAVGLFRYGDRMDCRGEPDWDAWRETSDTDGDGQDGERRRRDAAGEIRHCRSLHGRHRREVRRLLGKPGEISPAVRGDHTFYAYYLGPDWLGLDSEWFDIEFDRGGRVVGIDVVGG